MAGRWELGQGRLAAAAAVPKAGSAVLGLAARDAHLLPPRPAPAYRYAQAFVDAADAVGAGACVSVVVLDSAGNLLASRKVRSSVEADAASTPVSGLTVQCQAVLLPALRVCNGSSAELDRGSECCGAMEGVGPACLDQVALAFQDNSAASTTL